jgi:DNA-binding MltR family transcriptional regulator
MTLLSLDTMFSTPAPTTSAPLPTEEREPLIKTGKQSHLSVTTRYHPSLTVTVEWAFHMVTAAVKFSSSTNHDISIYNTSDAARWDILNVLNWLEAHNEYAWPESTKPGLEFSQAMRFRRALVSDVFAALEKANSIRVTGEDGMPGTPQSEGSIRKRTSGNG